MRPYGSWFLDNSMILQVRARFRMSEPRSYSYEPFNSGVRAFPDKARELRCPDAPMVSSRHLQAVRTDGHPQLCDLRLGRSFGILHHQDLREAIHTGSENQVHTRKDLRIGCSLTVNRRFGQRSRPSQLELLASTGQDRNRSFTTVGKGEPKGGRARSKTAVLPLHQGGVCVHPCVVLPGANRLDVLGRGESAIRVGHDIATLPQEFLNRYGLSCFGCLFEGGLFSSGLFCENGIVFFSKCRRGSEQRQSQCRSGGHRCRTGQGATHGGCQSGVVRSVPRDRGQVKSDRKALEDSSRSQPPRISTDTRKDPNRLLTWGLTWR